MSLTGHSSVPRDLRGRNATLCVGWLAGASLDALADTRLLYASRRFCLPEPFGPKQLVIPLQ